jgi:hypothetical protein
VGQSSNQPLATPNLNVAVPEQALGPFDGFVVVIANDRLEADEMLVDADGISPVLYHPESPHLRMAENNHRLKINIVRYRTQIQNRPLRDARQIITKATTPKIERGY